MKRECLDKIYASWLGKIIGIRLGAPIEGWDYYDIKKKHPSIAGYLVDYKDFAADDDSNGPYFFSQALKDYSYDKLTARDIGKTWLNYSSYQKGLFWWGGYGMSTENTAYLNLASGIDAPFSGSIALNGKTVAEQIGGQIFIDVWGMISPGNPKKAVEYAKMAASVSHDGNGIYGGMFVAAAISTAFEETDILAIINSAKALIPEDCEYVKMADDVIAFYKSNPDDWEKCYHFVRDNYGYDKYDGNCHIIPNSAIIILSLLYSEGDFSKAICICNMCGWDTDCNVANVGAIMGARGGTACIDYEKWRKPINDFIAYSGVLGDMNISTIPEFVYYIAKYAYKIAGVAPDKDLEEKFSNNNLKLYFDFSGETSAIRSHSMVNLLQSDGELTASFYDKAVENDLFLKTYYHNTDFYDSRYDPAFSPIFYPGMSFSLKAKTSLEDKYIKLYAKNEHGDKLIISDTFPLNNALNDFSFTLPSIDGGLICEIGLITNAKEITIDDFEVYGNPSYSVDFSKESIERWYFSHRELTQFTTYKGLYELIDGNLALSCSDVGAVYTGSQRWGEIALSVNVIPKFGNNHRVIFNNKGNFNNYILELSGDKISLIRNFESEKVLTSVDFNLVHDTSYSISIINRDKKIEVYLNEKAILSYEDSFLVSGGGVGFGVKNGSRCYFNSLKIN